MLILLGRFALVIAILQTCRAEDERETEHVGEDAILRDYSVLESDREGRAIWTGKAKSDHCRGSVTHLSANEATILKSHRGYGKTPYPANYNCRWLLIPQECDLGLECNLGTYRNLRRSRSFEKCVGGDYLRVLGERGHSDTFYCGENGPNVTFSGNNAVALVFKSNDRKNDEELERQSFGIGGFNCKIVCRPREKNDNILKETTTLKPQQTTSSRPFKFSTHRPGVTTGKPGGAKPKPTTPPCHCGESRQARIVCPQGHNCTAGLGEIPWQAGLVNRGSNQPWCGGSLINSRYVLTAAHCMIRKSASRIQVVLGDHDWTTKAEGPDFRFGIAEIVRHPRFGKRAQYDFDFALLKLDRAVDFNRMSRVRPVCLPNDADIRDHDVLIGREGVASGWGVLNPKIPNQQAKQLQQVFVKIMSNSQCRSKYPNNPITETMICAQDKDTDACYGDSGGPFTVRDQSSGKSVLEGVISWGKNCAQARWPGVYARVRTVLPWIRQNLRAGEFCWKDDRLHRSLAFGDDDEGEDDKEKEEVLEEEDAVNFGRRTA